MKKAFFNKFFENSIISSPVLRLVTKNYCKIIESKEKKLFNYITQNFYVRKTCIKKVPVKKPDTVFFKSFHFRQSETVSFTTKKFYLTGLGM